MSIKGTVEANMRLDEILSLIDPDIKVAMCAFGEARRRMPAINASVRRQSYGFQIFVGTWSMMLMKEKPSPGKCSRWEATLMEVCLPLDHILDEFDTYPAALAFFRVVLTALAEAEKEIPF